MNITEIYEWLIIAFSEPLNSLTEAFYYDKRDKEFYSIHMADFLLLNDDLTLNESASSSYSDSIAQLIANRIQRREAGDKDIVEIDRLALTDRKSIMGEFAKGIYDEKLLAILQQRIKNQDGTQRFDFYFGSEATDQTKEDWQRLKNKSLIPVIDQFLESNGIILEQSRVWDIGNDFEINLKLT